MTRVKLGDRRPSITRKLEVPLEGVNKHILLTIGFRDDAMTDPAEVFCASFKVGTALNSIVSDSCVLLSRLMQHGDTPAELAATLCRPPSLVGAIAAAVAEMADHPEGATADG